MKPYDATNGTLLKALVMSFQNKTRFETALKQMSEQADESWDALANKLERDLAGAPTTVAAPLTPLVEAAQDVLKDDRHWSLVDVADRAEAAKGLAESILAVVGAEERQCPNDCADCREHNKNTGG